MGAKSYFKSMERGFPGGLSRVHEGGYTLESKVVDAPQDDANELFIGNGVVYTATGNVAAVEDDFAPAQFAGLVVRPYPSQGIGSITGEDEPIEPSSIVTVMRRGYMTVRVASGTPAARGQVYVRTASPTVDIPLGSVVADTTNSTAVSGAFFTGAASTQGVAEIEYNIAPVAANS
jgi:hypothetical protein